MEWLTSTQAAKELGITLRTLHRIIDRGELTAYRFGRVIRIKQTDLEDFLERSRIQSGNI